MPLLGPFLAPLLLLLWVPSPAGAPGSVATTPWSAPLGRPLAVLREFDPPPADRLWLVGHRGVDLAAGAGDAVRSPAAGVVGFAGMLAGRGVVVVVHGLVRSTFEAVRPLVRVGDRVVAGSVLGLVSSVPPHCGPRACLHWGVLEGRRYLDPMSFLAPSLRTTEVRLLPFVALAAETAADTRAGGPPTHGPPPALVSAAAASPVLRPPPGGPPRARTGTALLATGALTAGALAATGGLRLARRRPRVG